MNRLGNIVSKVNQKIGEGATAGLVVLVIIMALEVVGRYGFNHPFKGTTQLSGFLLAFITLLAGGYAFVTNSHIRVDIFYSRFSERGKAINDLITLPLFLFWAVCLVLHHKYSW